MMPDRPGWFTRYVEETKSVEEFRFLECGCRVGVATWGNANYVEDGGFRDPCSNHLHLHSEPC